jgi:hypothetical protein
MENAQGASNHEEETIGMYVNMGNEGTNSNDMEKVREIA